jgi:hypothetical protein
LVLAVLGVRRVPELPSALVERRPVPDVPSALDLRRALEPPSPPVVARAPELSSALRARRDLDVVVALPVAARPPADRALLDRPLVERRLLETPSLDELEACASTWSAASAPPALTACAVAMVCADAACSCLMSSVSCATFLRSLESFETRFANFASTFDCDLPLFAMNRQLSTRRYRGLRRAALKLTHDRSRRTRL